MKTEATAHPGIFVEETIKSPTFQAYQILHWAFVIAPIIAGVDKFFNKLTHWSMYLWPPLGNLVGGPETFMRIVGAIEIVAGFLVAFKPKLGAPIVAAWLLGIIVNLLLLGSYFDIALRDLGLFLAALALSRLALLFDHPHIAKEQI
jgi:uncharacterized membrane protein HdeD (DUF308 family)